PQSPHSLICALSLHDALPISSERERAPHHVTKADHRFLESAHLSSFRMTSRRPWAIVGARRRSRLVSPRPLSLPGRIRRPSAHSDRKSTRLNSSHLGISYAVF